MKENLYKAFTDFLRSIGIDPYLFFLLILCIMVVFKIKGYLKKQEKDKWDYIYDSVFFIVSIGLIVFFALYLFGIIS